MLRLRILAASLAPAMALGLAACAAGTYTGPVEVTRFAAPVPAGLGQGTIAVQFSQDIKNEAALDAFRAAIGDELSLLGYTVIANEEAAGQIARIDTSRSPLESSDSGDPVNVGVGGGTVTFGSGVGLGVGVNLGGGHSAPRVVSELRVAIASNEAGATPQNLWEARAQFPTSVNSPYAPIEINARTLAAAIFKDFPEGSGQTVSLNAEELVKP